MKKIVSILLSAMLLMSFCGCTVNTSKDVSTVVLEIDNKEQVKKKEFDNLVKYTMLQYYAYQETDLSNDEEQQLALKNDLYKTFVDRKIKEYACKKNKLKIKEKDVKKTAKDAVKALKKQIKGDKKSNKPYTEALKKFGFKDEEEFKKIAYNEAKLDAYSSKLSENFYDKHLDDKEIANFDMLKTSGKTFKAYLFYYYYIDQTLIDYINSTDAPSTEEETQVFYDNVAKKLVGDWNIIQAGKKQNIKVTKKEITEKAKTSAYPESVYGQKTIYDYIKNYGLSEKQYEKAKKFQARAAVYKEKMQEQINKDLENPKDEELEDFYNSHKERYNTATVSARHILVNEDKEDLANHIYKQVKEYGFEDVYNTYKKAKDEADEATEKKTKIDSKIESTKNEKKKKKLQKQADKLQETIDNAQYIQEATDLNAFTYSTMVEEFSDAAFGAKKDSTVGPVKTEFGYHIIYVYDKADGEVQEYKDVKDTVKSDYTSINTTERTEKEIDSLTEDVKYSFIEKDYPIFPYDKYVENFKEKYDVKEHNRKAVR